jgi:hypothetical protein
MIGTSTIKIDVLSLLPSPFLHPKPIQQNSTNGQYSAQPLQNGFVLHMTFSVLNGFMHPSIRCRNPGTPAPERKYAPGLWKIPLRNSPNETFFVETGCFSINMKRLLHENIPNQQRHEVPYGTCTAAPAIHSHEKSTETSIGFTDLYQATLDALF